MVEQVRETGYGSYGSPSGSMGSTSSGMPSADEETYGGGEMDDEPSDEF